MKLKRIGLIGILGMLLVPGMSQACGTWTFNDLERKLELRFLVSSVELEDPKRVNPRFIRAGYDEASFINGDHVSYRRQAGEQSGKILYKKRQSGIASKAKKPKSKAIAQEIGSFQGDEISLKGLGKIRITLKPLPPEKDHNGKLIDQRALVVENENGKQIGSGIIDYQCFGSASDGKAESPESFFQGQGRRVIAYYIFRSLKLDPYAKPAGSS